MIAAWMLYCVAIALMFVVVGEALERALHLARRPTRWAWAMALVGSIVVPTAAWLRPQAFGTIAVALPQSAAPGPLFSGHPQRTVARVATRPLSLADLDAVLAVVWALSCVAMLGSFFAAALRLRTLRRRWRPASMHGRTVLVSEEVGPALAGVWMPRVVVPDWALGLEERDQELLLVHEEEHLRTRDPWLLAAGAAALVLAPWNAALWWQLRRLRLAVEIDCDARVLAGGGCADAYGELLLRVGQERGRLPLVAPALGEPASFLARRIRRMVTALPRWRWAGATAAGLVATAAIIAACEAPRPVPPRASRNPAAAVPPEQVSYSPNATYLQRLGHQYHPEAFAHALPGTAIAFVFDAQDSVVGHAAGVREARDADCLAVVDRLVAAFRNGKWSSGGCAGAVDGAVVVYWKKLKQA